MKIYDEAGAELLYWPVSLVEGENSATLVIGVDAPAPNYTLRASADATVRVMARRHGTTDAYQDLASDPIDLSALTGPIAQFDVHVTALTPIIGLERHTLNIVAGQNVMAGYDS